jgi:hypothetical protein
MKLKAKLVVVLLSSLFANVAFAECKTAMGDCGIQEAGKAPQHMKAENEKKAEVKSVDLPTRSELEAAREAELKKKKKWW